MREQAAGFWVFTQPRPGTQHLFQERLDEGRHVAEPEREEQHQVLAPADGLLCRRQRGGEGSGFPLLLAAQQRDLQNRQVDQAHLMTLGLSALAVVIGQGMTQVRLAGIGVSLQDQDSLAHGGGLSRQAAWRQQSGKIVSSLGSVRKLTALGHTALKIGSKYSFTPRKLRLFADFCLV
jgi:hypothetical protein